MKETKFRQRYFHLFQILFLLLLLAQLLPNRVQTDPQTAYLLGFAVLAWLMALLCLSIIRERRKQVLAADLFAVLFGFLLLWTLCGPKTGILRETLFSSPGRVIQQLILDKAEIAGNIAASLGIIVKGYLLGGCLAVLLGLFLGWNQRLGSAAGYVTKFLSSIPPIVYIPYGIALLPTFRSVSVMVIFLATFWPVFASTMIGVMQVERRILDTAKSLHVGKGTMLFSVILPAALPQIFIGCNQGLAVSFILLTSAEMIGAQNGMGYYVKQYSDFGDYTRTIAGLLVIGTVVTLISAGFNRLQNRLLRWKV